MRAPLATSLQSRDGGVTKDAKVLNGLVELRGETPFLRKRPGLSDVGLIKAGIAQLLTYWNGTAITVQADYINVGSVVPGYGSWSAIDQDSDITLSNSNLTAAIATPSVDGVRSTNSATSGKYYFELTVPTVGATTNISVGAADSAWVYKAAAGRLGTDTHGVSYRPDGNIYYNNSLLTTAGAWSNGDVIAVAMEVGVSVKFYKNNVLQYTSTSIPVGTTWHFALGGTGAGVSSSSTANFGGSTFTYTPPTGYAGIYQTFILTGSTALNPSTASLPFSAQDNGSNAPKSYLMVKNASQAWTVDTSGTVAQITDVDYPGTYAVTLTGLTRSGTTATATTAADTNFQVGSTVVIAGANQSDYNGSQVITSITSTVAIPGVPVDVTITRSGTTATVTTVSEPHGFVDGASVVIAGAGQVEYNGTKTITLISATQFSFTVTVTPGGVTSPATGTVTYLVVAQNASVAVSGLTATVTHAGHGYATGAKIDLYWGSGLGQPMALDTAVTVTDANTYTLTVTTSYGAGPGACKVFTHAKTVSSLTGVAVSPGDILTGTITTSVAHNLKSGDLVYIGGAEPYYYRTDGTPRAITVTGSTTFTYQGIWSTPTAESPSSPATGTITATKAASVTGASFTFTVANSPVTPATGTITATGGRNTVPGIAYLDGYFAVMDIFGVIYNSAEDNPSVWNALEYTTALAETGAGKAIARSLNYLVAFKEWSTELFWDAKNEPPGSPFSPVENGFTQVGCASGFSVALLDGNLFWLAQARQKGRSVYVMQGTAQQKISTPDVERILNADDLATVHAWGVKLDGHSLYVLTLVTSNITLVYDMGSQTWGQWSSNTLGSSKSVTSITRSGTTATVTTGTAHGLSDGDPAKISGADQSEYNGIFQISYVSTTVFTIEVAGSPATPATGTILAYPYTETYFKFTKGFNVGGLDGLLHESDGHLYKLLSSVYQDEGIPINVFARTPRMDGGTLMPKRMPKISVIADSVADYIMVRWSDDDSANFSTYRRIHLSDERPNTRRCGAFKRRTIEARHIGNTPLNAAGLELEIT